MLALKYDKYCLLEKPAALNYRDIDALVAAESSSKAKVFVGYMRRYAAAFLRRSTKSVGSTRFNTRACAISSGRIRYS